MSAFATADDLRLRWRACPTGISDEALEALLLDASVWLMTVFSIPSPPDEKLAAVLRTVTCAMVKRSQIADDADGAEQVTDTQGPFSTSLKFSNAEGNFYLTRQERELIDKALNTDDAAAFRSVTACGW